MHVVRVAGESTDTRQQHEQTDYDAIHLSRTAVHASVPKRTIYINFELKSFP